MMMTMMMGPRGPGTLGPRAKRAQGPIMMMIMLMVMMFDNDVFGESDSDDV